MWVLTADQASSGQRRRGAPRHNRRVNLRWIRPTDSIGAQRGDVVVCIPVFAGHEHFVSCIGSVLAHTPAAVPILVCDDASPDERSQELVRKLADDSSSEHEVFYLRRERNLGFPANVNGAFAIAAPADVVILNSDCVVADGWLEGLLAAADGRQPDRDGDRAHEPRQRRLGARAWPTAVSAAARMELRRGRRRGSGARAEAASAVADRGRALHADPPQRARARR